MTRLKHFTPYLYHVIAELDNITSQLILEMREYKNTITSTYSNTIKGVLSSIGKLSGQLESLANLFE